MHKLNDLILKSHIKMITKNESNTLTQDSRKTTIILGLIFTGLMLFLLISPIFAATDLATSILNIADTIWQLVRKVAYGIGGVALGVCAIMAIVGSGKTSQAALEKAKLIVVALLVLSLIGGFIALAKEFRSQGGADNWKPSSEASIVRMIETA